MSKKEGFDRRAFLKGAIAGSAAATVSIEAVVDHIVPADAYSPKGTDLGINVYIDRALAGGWGKGERLYLQGPWRTGTSTQGYQLPLTPAALYRAGIDASNAACMKAYGKTFDKIDARQRQEFLVGLQSGKVVFEHGPPSAIFFATLYANVMEGMFADSVIAVHHQNVEKYRDKKYAVDPVGIGDMSGGASHGD